MNQFEVALRNARAAHPEKSIGQLLEMAASISLAMLKQRASSATDEQLIWGLRALIPFWDEDSGKWL